MRSILRAASKFLFPLVIVTPVWAQFPLAIRNVVVIVQENRTPDNLFHFLTPACSIPTGASGLNACTPSPVTNSCYDISPCGLSNQSKTVEPITLTGIPLMGSPDPTHTHAAFEDMCDPDSSFKCRNDGAWKTVANGAAYSYVLSPAVTNYDGSSGHLLDPYLTFATQYGWSNFMYQTNQGPSYPAHQFLFSGSSAMTDGDDASSIFVAENFSGSSESGCLLPASTSATPVFNAVLEPGNLVAAGCEHFDNDSVQECRLDNTIGPNNVGTFCLSHSNMATTVLDPNQVSWKYYGPSASDIWTAPDAFQEICAPGLNSKGELECTGAEWSAHVDVSNHGVDVLKDIADCKLSQVSWVIPDGAWSDHAAVDNQYGPSWVAAVINAIGNNPTCAAGTTDAGQTFWENTAVVLTWDDWGGWSDNQPADVQGALPCVITAPSVPCPAAYQYGFRVPLIVVSAYTPQGYIDNTPDDFGSILRMIEGVNHVQEGMLGNADSRSTTDLSTFFSLKLPRRYVTVPAVEDASFFLTYKGAVSAPDND
jgi:phospholipase C